MYSCFLLVEIIQILVSTQRAEHDISISVRFGNVHQYRNMVSLKYMATDSWSHRVLIFVGCIDAETLSIKA